MTRSLWASLSPVIFALYSAIALPGPPSFFVEFWLPVHITVSFFTILFSFGRPSVKPLVRYSSSFFPISSVLFGRFSFPRLRFSSEAELYSACMRFQPT
uniref:Uncharacterized protein n=1 Tax=Amblyomma triste TaxID=251400 RepID=A0A023G3Y2_AMBTT